MNFVNPTKEVNNNHCHSSIKPLFFQPKLTINQPNDIYEQEADAMADKVMRMGDKQTMHESFFKPAISSVQRKCAKCEEDDKKVQRKEVNNEVASTDNYIENYTGGLNSLVQSLPYESFNFSSSREIASTNIENSLNSSKGTGFPLPTSVLGKMENSFGMDFSSVRLHTDSSAVQMSKDLNAQAFTYGKDIYFNSGKYETNSTNGQHLLAHELTHTVQQSKMVQKKIQAQGFTGPIDFDSRLFSRLFNLQKGNSLRLLVDSHRKPAGCTMPDSFNAYLYNTINKRYENPQPVSYLVDARQEFTWKGLSAGTYQFIFKFQSKPGTGCKVTGSMDVSEENPIDKVASTSRKYVGSKDWSIDVVRGDYGKGTNKCNLFVFEVLNEAGTSVSKIERTRGWGILDSQYHPPLAGQWANKSYSIPGWVVVDKPQPGDIVAQQINYSDASGHCGIVTEVAADGSTGLSVSDSSITETIVENDWGFRADQKGKVVFRRYVGK